MGLLHVITHILFQKPWLCHLLFSPFTYLHCLQFYVDRRGTREAIKKEKGKINKLLFFVWLKQ